MISSNIEANNLESTVEMNFCKIRSTVNVNKEIETNSCLNHPKSIQIESSMKGIKSLIKETLYNSLAQAIIKLIETPIFTLKVFLFLCVILSSGLCSYLIIELIISYLSFDVSTKSRTLYETPALFPKITFCNVNPFTAKNSMEYLKKLNRELHPEIDIFNDEQISKLDFIERNELIKNFIGLKALYKMNELNETEKMKLSHPLEEILDGCSFNSQPCTADDFSWHFDPWYGNCWIFNSGLNRTGQQQPLGFSSQPGEYYGLRMGLYVNFYQNLTEINSYTGSLGALIRIDNSSYLTIYNPLDGIKLEPGHFVSVSLSRSFKTNLPRPYSNCLIDNETNAGFNSELFDLIQNSNYKYTQSTCFWQCIQRTTLKQCNCTDPTIISFFPSASKCFEQNEIDCIDLMWTKGKLLKHDYYEENCQSDCPLECYTDSIDVSLSSTELIP